MPTAIEIKERYAEIARACDDYRTIRRDIDAWIGREKRRRHKEARADVARLVASAHAEGATVTAIAEALGTKNRQTVYNLIAEGSAQ